MSDFKRRVDGYATDWLKAKNVTAQDCAMILKGVIAADDAEPAVPVAALQELAKKWREATLHHHEYDEGRDDCTDELTALIQRHGGQG